MLRQQLLNDLRWAIQSPSLLNPKDSWFPFDEEARNVQQQESSFDFKNVDQHALVDFIGDPVPRRVGRYFEKLVLFWLQHCRQVEILSAGQQIKHDGETIGEIDVLFRDEKKQIQHWESAVKFYLDARGTNSLNPAKSSPESGPVGTLVGPNVRDAFHFKLKRLLEHQLPLSEQCSFPVDVRRAFVKGRIFYHFREANSTLASLQLSPSHLRAQWLYHRELQDFLIQHPGSYRQLCKPY